MLAIVLVPSNTKAAPHLHVIDVRAVDARAVDDALVQVRGTSVDGKLEDALDVFAPPVSHIFMYVNSRVSRKLIHECALATPAPYQDLYGE